eukprot:GHVU01128513.1.p2 GENE.GHVU01128513.1~~GHVU01128513.1.p2  ORF type:complete len:119 (-),score=12.86 GHVU01128513.1:878-1234(-)
MNAWMNESFIQANSSNLREKIDGDTLQGAINLPPIHLPMFVERVVGVSGDATVDEVGRARCPPAQGFVADGSDELFDARARLLGLVFVDDVQLRTLPVALRHHDHLPCTSWLGIAPIE